MYGPLPSSEYGRTLPRVPVSDDTSTAGSFVSFVTISAFESVEKDDGSVNVPDSLAESLNDSLKSFVGRPAARSVSSIPWVSTSSCDALGGARKRFDTAPASSLRITIVSSDSPAENRFVATTAGLSTGSNRQ